MSNSGKQYDGRDITDSDAEPEEVNSLLSVTSTVKKSDTTFVICAAGHPEIQINIESVDPTVFTLEGYFWLCLDRGSGPDTETTYAYIPKLLIPQLKNALDRVAKC